MRGGLFVSNQRKATNTVRGPIAHVTHATNLNYPHRPNANYIHSVREHDTHNSHPQQAR